MVTPFDWMSTLSLLFAIAGRFCTVAPNVFRSNSLTTGFSFPCQAGFTYSNRP